MSGKDETLAVQASDRRIPSSEAFHCRYPWKTEELLRATKSPGSGNWGSVAAKLIATSTRALANFHDEVTMWVYEEALPDGPKLTEIINHTNENVKYLPGLKLGSNVVAQPDLETAVGCLIYDYLRAD